MQILKDNMKKAALKGFINATDCADYLTKKGMPFRDAYKTVGQLVAQCCLLYTSHGACDIFLIKTTVKGNR